jgi:GT2 family glycosyltransferase
MYKTAVLLTCHNRKEKTKRCLTNFFKQQSFPENIKFDVFLVDDGSTDGTSDMVRKDFPLVNIIKGTGNLFWNQGMRLAWHSAELHTIYDFFLWLNDDTYIDSNCINSIFVDYYKAKDIAKTEVIISGACRESEDSKLFSYGGRDDHGPIIPNGEIQKCKYINGNIVLIPRKIYESIGLLSNVYTHSLGDFDYGLRAIENKFSCFTTKNYVGICEPNLKLLECYDPKINFIKRWNNFHSPNGLHIREYLLFRKRFWGIKWIVFAIKAYLKMFNPRRFNN